MKRMLSLALTCTLACGQLVSLGAQAQPTGVVSGSVASSSGRQLSGITMQLLNAGGSVVGSAVTTRDGDFSIPGIAIGMYTLQCVASGKVIGTSSVTLSGPSESVKMTCTSDAAGFWKTRGVLTALAAAATAIGAAAVVATRGDASGAQ